MSAQKDYDDTCGRTYDWQIAAYDALEREARNYMQIYYRVSVKSDRTIVSFWDDRGGGKILRMSVKNMIRYLIRTRYVEEYEFMRDRELITRLGYDCALAEDLMIRLDPQT